jgi:hypothetical protein
VQQQPTSFFLLKFNVTQVQSKVGGSNAVSKEAVFPLFNQLGALHKAITEELRLLVVRQRLYEDLEKARGQVGWKILLLWLKLLFVDGSREVQRRVLCVAIFQKARAGTKVEASLCCAVLCCAVLHN